MEAGFVSLLGLLKDGFEKLNFSSLKEAERIELGRHFVQRGRGDVKKWLGEETPFPERDPDEKTYNLSQKYKDLFEDVYSFSRELVRSGETLTGWRQHIRFWTALALLRCVMSSPAGRARPDWEAPGDGRG